MKKAFIFSLIIIPFMSTSHAALNWWDQPTVCRANPSKCYNTMGAGYNADEWDSDADCRGKKIICGAALKPASNDNWTFSKKDIRDMNGINSDFNINILNGDCFGSRKTISNGLQAIYNNEPIDVYCAGVLENIYDYDYIERVETGSILARTNQPKCSELAEYGYARAKNGNCYGKKYPTTKYYIDCASANDTRLIVLNGANYTEPMGNNPRTLDAAEELFKQMIATAKELREK